MKTQVVSYTQIIKLTLVKKNKGFLLNYLGWQWKTHKNLDMKNLIFFGYVQGNT